VPEQEWLAIYRETVRPLYGYLARRTGGDRALTEDIVQEAYLRALDSWNPRALPDTPLAWLKRTARNILIDHLRRQKKGAGTGWRSDPRDGQGASGDPFESLELFLAVTSLGRKKAGILEAFYYEGSSVREIAAERGISEKAVEGLLRRARQALKALLPGQRSEEGEDA
jgi:RNA polymerase sigma-70 factor (ECF subfamily)